MKTKTPNKKLWAIWICFKIFLSPKMSCVTLLTPPPPRKCGYIVGSIFVSVPQKTGSEYEPTSLRNMLYSFERDPRNHQNGESLVTSIKFAKPMAALKSKQKDLKKSGLGNKSKSANRITDSEIDKLFEYGELRIYLLQLAFLTLCGSIIPCYLEWGVVRRSIVLYARAMYVLTMMLS